MKKLTRQQAIDEMRVKLLSMVDDDHSLCQVVGELGIFCKGFKQWDFAELNKRYGWITRKRPQMTRKELEDIANRWQLARKEVLGTEIACDTQLKEHHTCLGWHEFSDEQLMGFYKELLHKSVKILPVEKDAAEEKNPET